jgi:RNA polymerase sigma-70 factor (ECF subfamily)
MGRMWNLRGQWVAPLWATRPRTEKSVVRSNIMASAVAPSPYDIIVRARRFGPHPRQSRPLATDKELTDFLKNVEKRAFKRTAYTVRDDEAALDIVQDSMIRVAEKYADRPAEELPLIFQRILSNATMDWFRRQKVRNAVLVNLSDFEGADDEGGDFDLLELLDTSDQRGGTESAADSVDRQQILGLIEAEVERLPGRQREAFLLRYWEELDVAETAAVMGCSEGSVKTHCSRAVHALAKALRAKGIAP